MKSQRWISSLGPGPVGPCASRLPSSLHTSPPPPPRVVGIRSGRFDEENPFVQNSSVLLVQADEGVSVLVVDRIGDYLPQSTEKSRVLVIPVGARHKCQQVLNFRSEIRKSGRKPPAAACDGAYMHGRAFAKPRNRLAHSLRTAADSWRLLHVRWSHIADQSMREVARSCALLDGGAASHGPRKLLRVERRESPPPSPMVAYHTAPLHATLADDDCTSVGHRRALLAGRCRVVLCRCVRGGAPACALAALVIFMAAPAGRRSGESPVMS
ncbi:Cytoplasmic dynein heavy chain [Dorcoceras hygrometricum]|uniref:Cytoplasmic dynein heavy chain n=1 Tax=Dorcoceras hygrometricum TaxID=472368 RepID=A0A2Z7C542_9LAMI|nr:Cytoplasmic dynein heavy chain [Dorcoceras hygrometricum]